MRQVLDGVDGELGAGETGQGGLTVPSQLRITLKPFIPQEIGEKPDKHDANEHVMVCTLVVETVTK